MLSIPTIVPGCSPVSRVTNTEARPKLCCTVIANNRSHEQPPWRSCRITHLLATYLVSTSVALQYRLLISLLSSTAGKREVGNGNHAVHATALKSPAARGAPVQCIHGIITIIIDPSQRRAQETKRAQETTHPLSPHRNMTTKALCCQLRRDCGCKPGTPPYQPSDNGSPSPRVHP